MTLFVGIDPGGSGGIAVLSDGGVSAIAMPDGERALLDALLEIASSGERAVAAIEQVGGFMAEREGGDAENEKFNRASSHTMFAFGRNYGSLRMGLVAAGFVEGESLYAVIPRTWQRGLGMESRRKVGRKYVESHSQFKRRLKAKAEELFPGESPTLSTCDAMLIALYCKRRFG